MERNLGILVDCMNSQQYALAAKKANSIHSAKYWQQAGGAAPSKPAPIDALAPRCYKSVHQALEKPWHFLQEEHCSTALAELQLLHLLPLAFAVSFGDVPYLPWDV